MAAKGTGVTGLGDQSDGGAADASADVGDHGTGPSSERSRGANRRDRRAAGHPAAFHLMLQNLFCFLPA